MKKADVAKRVARQSRITPAEAADKIDRVVHQILSNLRKGESVAVTGLGKFKAGKKWEFESEGNEGA
ncbi:MAG: HU family DNA-binding protein [Bryobacteraceae bacterium]